MERERYGGQRRSAAVEKTILILSIALFTLSACSSRDQVESWGWSSKGDPIALDQRFSVEDSTKELLVSISLPPGFQASDGFFQQLTITASDLRQEIEIPDLDRSIFVRLPQENELLLSLSIGFCTVEAKDICYVDRSELTITRHPGQNQAVWAELEYRPEAPL